MAGGRAGARRLPAHLALERLHSGHRGAARQLCTFLQLLRLQARRQACSVLRGASVPSRLGGSSPAGAQSRGRWATPRRSARGVCPACLGGKPGALLSRGCVISISTWPCPPCVPLSPPLLVRTPVAGREVHGHLPSRSFAKGACHDPLSDEGPGGREFPETEQRQEAGSCAGLAGAGPRKQIWGVRSLGLCQRGRLPSVNSTREPGAREVVAVGAGVSSSPPPPGPPQEALRPTLGLLKFLSCAL